MSETPIPEESKEISEEQPKETMVPTHEDFVKFTRDFVRKETVRKGGKIIISLEELQEMAEKNKKK